VCLVVRQYPFDGCDTLKDRILEKFPEVKSLSVMINRREDNVILDGKEVLLSGKPYIEEVLLGKRFRISARSFFQVNPYATEILYGTALEYAGLTGKEILIDLYCGTGTIGILASDKCRKVYGIEIVSEAIKDAKENMKLNGIENIDFLNMDAEKGAAAVVRSKIKADVVIVDPPRKGCSRDTLTAIEKIAPKKIVYVSCDPATLARDVEILLNETDYQLIKVQPVDLFPNTHHIETVCLLSKLHGDKHIEVEVTMDEMDLTSAESKATYEEIKAYVLEKFGLHVSHLYIAQVKRKCGIIERANYNLPKSENSRQPQCPPEKEAAIRVALEHFQMI